MTRGNKNSKVKKKRRKKKTAKSKIRLYCAQNYSTKNVIFLTPRPVINHLIWYMNLLPYTSG